MSVKGFFIAIACVLLGGWGFVESLTKLMSGDTATLWLIILAISFLAMFFGMGVFANKIKL